MHLLPHAAVSALVLCRPAAASPSLNNHFRHHQASLQVGSEGPDRAVAVLQGYKLLNLALEYDQAAAEQFNSWTAVERVRERVSPLHHQLLSPPHRIAVLLLYVMHQDMDLQLEVGVGAGARAGSLPSRLLSCGCCWSGGHKDQHTRPLAPDECVSMCAHSAWTHACHLHHAHAQVIRLLGQLAARLPDLVSLLQPNFDESAAILIRQGFAQVRVLLGMQCRAAPPLSPQPLSSILSVYGHVACMPVPQPGACLPAEL